MKLALINRFLLVAVIALNLYIISLPFYTIMTFWAQKHLSHRPQQLSELVKTLPARPLNRPAEELIIPSIALDQSIVEGRSTYTVDKGVWHWPKGASPGQSGNTVLIGHRFTYKGPAVFAHLDLVKLGDNITLVWHGQKISYSVSQTKLVSPNDTSIIQPTSDKRITIYTCAPMWHTTYRLAVIGQEERS